jgi:hypothetical protein
MGKYKPIVHGGDQDIGIPENKVSVLEKKMVGVVI